MDFEFCILFPKVIGTYRQPGGVPPCDVYGTRWEYLPMRKRTFFQVRVRCGDGLLWINVDANDVTLEDQCPA